MGKSNVDLTGLVFGRLTVIRPAEKRGRNTTSLCRCACGTEKVILNANLKSGSSKSCGCGWSIKAKERWADPVLRRTMGRKTVHGLTGSPEYVTYRGMIGRCYSPKNTKFHRYGGRGVRVCERWRDEKHGLANFIADMGPRPKGMSIDRHPNPDGDYEPGNCRWATVTQQNRNIGLKKSNTHGFKGINKNSSGWTAEIRSNRGKHYLGFFKTKEEAAYAYDVASLALHGADGVRNDVTPPANAEGIRKKVLERVGVNPR